MIDRQNGILRITERFDDRHDITHTREHKNLGVLAVLAIEIMKDDDEDTLEDLL